jgi:hypothetical protein
VAGRLSWKERPVPGLTMRRSTWSAPGNPVPEPRGDSGGHPSLGDTARRLLTAMSRVLSHPDHHREQERHRDTEHHREADRHRVSERDGELVS